MRETLEALAAGEISVTAAESRLAGYATGEAGRFDAAREQRRGVPEAVLADGKTSAEVAELVALAVETTGRGLATRVDPATADAVVDRLADDRPDATVAFDERTGVLRAHAAEYETPDLEAVVGVVTAGTADTGPAGEAAAVVREMGATVEQVDDVGVAGLHRALDRLEDIRRTDVLVVAAGREGALPTVLAGLVDAPVIGLPVASGYGHGGDGEAALAGLLQSCTVLTVVNVDAGFVAGAQAGLIARAVDAARDREPQRDE
ncbi:nickel pincer cofactor biosynthesis protein LarB [Halococcus saccharolyticus]|uniref:1-(5-phosphoribosyl)-5-amino-4-imidazole-carboxylate (AIR) carboxylase n=1 Tax=Halococcus saccharolyticus DSM 5350 TaxID=1227455 RepID=M0MH33_9EURY|nr:nickel pincer cofactor biosynthesis protein LarB [Halococcus saccharolyticus]EMA43745.1 1-(5-phosphoribosyl)-5-amino-4-imidazole- carboxylate (AIR) carboxylase [Halococcus saccharolyticus DSM 5350]